MKVATAKHLIELRIDHTNLFSSFIVKKTILLHPKMDNQ